MMDWIKCAQSPDIQDWQYIEIKTRDGSVFGPIPFGLIADGLWQDNALHYSHDIAAYRLVI